MPESAGESHLDEIYSRLGPCRDCSSYARERGLGTRVGVWWRAFVGAVLMFLLTGQSRRHLRAVVGVWVGFEIF